jgi:transposase
MGEYKKRRTYDKAFKQEAVRLVLEEGCRCIQVERDLGISKGVVARWVKEFQEDSDNAFPGKGNLKSPEEELQALKRELERVKRERDILKKAVAIFSTDPNRYTDS